MLFRYFTSCAPAVRTTLAVCVGCVVSVSCGGPQTAPAQKIRGIETPAALADNPHDAVGAPGLEPFLEEFIAGVVSAHGADPGSIAVFPAVTRFLDTGQARVTGLGEYFMETTAADLERAGISALHSGALVNDLIAGGVRPSLYQTSADVWPLAQKIGAKYVVAGAIKRKVFDRMRQDVVLDVDWECWKLGSGDEPSRVVASFRRELSGGPLAAELNRHSRVRSEWQALVDGEAVEAPPPGSP